MPPMSHPAAAGTGDTKKSRGYGVAGLDGESFSEELDEIAVDVPDSEAA